MLFRQQASALVQREVLPGEKTQGFLLFSTFLAEKEGWKAAEPSPSRPSGKRGGAQMLAISIPGCMRKSTASKAHPLSSALVGRHLERCALTCGLCYKKKTVSEPERAH